MNSIERHKGSLLGLAVGDALGVALEFRQRDRFEKVIDIIGGGKFQLKPGFYTDDTCLALCLAESLIETGSFDPIDQLQRYRRWMMEGYMSPTGTCVGIGRSTLASIREFAKTGKPPTKIELKNAGNGSLMRLAPVVLRYYRPGDSTEAVKFAAESSLTTHTSPIAVDACRYFAHCLHNAIEGYSKEKLLTHDWAYVQLHDEVERIAKGSFKKKNRAEISSSGYVVHTLEAALWAFFNTNTFEDGMILAVNLADDADTVGAVYGQLAGAYYGKSSIPERWQTKLANSDVIEEMAGKLHQLSGHNRLP
ncbi:MAG: ADP-ribosylglycohydrolase family protein [Patescibacteria group bacterium]